MSVNIKPLGDYLVAEPEEAPTKTASGLYLPEKSAEKPKIATVVALGPNVRQLKVGDRIVYKSYSPTELKVDGVDYLLVKEEDVLATLK
ncbi:MAG TPA: co-chaperone GroES [Patescibacteria group bacterium]|nr:co-chaperone GroES [Patescibacteria group bacterium]